MDPFSKTFLNKISLNVTGYMEISMDPLQGKAFLNNVSLNVTGYMEISVDPLGKSIFFNNVSLSYRVHGNFYGRFLTLSVKHLKFTTICSRNNVSVFLKDIYLFLRYVCTSEYKKSRHCRDICHAQVVK